MDLYNKAKSIVAKPTLHDEVQEDAEEDYLDGTHDQVEEGKEDDPDRTPQEHKHAMHNTFRRFRIPGINKADVDGYIRMTRPVVRTLIEEQVEEMESAKVQLILWIMWKKIIMLAVQPNTEDQLGGEDFQEPGEGFYDRVGKLFNSKVTEMFQGSYIDDILDIMFSYIKNK